MNQTEFQQLISSNSVKDLTTFLDEFQEEHSISWLPVGNRQDNIATINIGTDPAAGVTERITNAIDAVLDLEWHKQGEPTDVISPRAAAESWFGIPEGRLRSFSKSSLGDIRALSQRIKVTLRDSENSSKPTVEIRDNGIGIKPEDFSKTILSLHGGNKLKKLFLMGAYGQGGSTALSYNNYTIIISKPFYDDKPQPYISWTIVRINQGDINVDKHEWFEYLVDRKTKQPIVFEVSDEEFPHGTLVRHVAMELGKYTAAVTQLTGSMWYLAHNYLFDTILPFQISDERQSKTKKESAENRMVTGNNRLLWQGENTEHKKEVSLTFRDGKVVIYYWVLSQEGAENPRDRILGYTMASQPILITFNGQKQGYLPNTIVKNDLRLPFLDRYLIVQIECDRLDNESKRQLFSSTRESLRDTSILDELRKLTIDTLKEDDHLVVLDRERKERYLQKDENDALDNLRKRLANRINVFVKAAGSGSTVKAAVDKPSGKRKVPLEIPVQDPPTFLEIVGPIEKEVTIGKTFSVPFKTDAHPNYFYNPDNFIAVFEPHSFGSFTGKANVEGGYGRAYFVVSENVEPGSIGKLTMELRPPRLKSLSCGLDCIAKPTEEDANSGNKGSKNTPSIDIVPMNETMQYYRDNKWTYDTVADVEISKEAVTIIINDSNKNLTKLIAKAKNKGPEAVEALKIRYREHIGFTAFMIDQNRVEETLEVADGAEIPSDLVETVKRADLSNACEAICGILTDFFDIIVTEAKEE